MKAKSSKRDEEGSTAVHTWLILTKARRILEIYAQRSIDTLDICGTDFGVLELLLHKGPLPVNTIGKRVFISSGSITAAIDRLESMKMVVRHDDPKDGRIRVVALTEHGETLIREKFAEHTADMDMAFSVLEETEILQLQSLLRKLGKGAEFGLNLPTPKSKSAIKNISKLQQIKKAHPKSATEVSDG